MRRLFLNASIRNKIIMITCSISFAIALLMSTVLGLREYARISESFNDRLTLEAQIISDNVGTALLFQDNEVIKETIDSFYVDEAIIRVKLFDQEGELFFESTRNTQYSSSLESTFIEKRVVVDEELIGELHIEAVNFQLNEVINEIVEMTLINLSVSLLLSIGLAAVLQRLISSPVIKLYRTAALIAKTQDYSLRVEGKSDDEVGQLSSMFNEMLVKVEQRDEKLERLVEQRTLELEKLADEFRHRAFHDSLTGLPNRALLHERFDLAVEHAERHKNNFACLLLDLDNFKTINDTKGHNYGDQLLIEVANRLKSTVRSEDLVCRLGGDEFVVLLIDLYSEDNLKKALNKVIGCVGEDFYIDDELVKTGVSIGASFYPEHGRDLNSIKRKADVAMYRAKEAGKNCYFIYTEDMQEDVRHRLMIQTDLNQAIEEEQLILYFQPKIALAEKQVTGCEVLIRWQHPKEGFMAPNDFIPFAEETTQIVEVDYYVLRKACETLSRWKKNGIENLSLAVNLSGRHFTDYHVVHKLQEYLFEFEINPTRLEIEITEAVLIDDPEIAQLVVAEIKKLGLRLSLDDFGTGYSSLNYLRTLPIDCIKLDHTFIQRIDMNMQDKRLINGIMSMGKGLSLELVAEGVETQAQLSILQEMQCHFVQGYYFLKPVSESDFLDWLASCDLAQLLE